MDEEYAQCILETALALQKTMKGETQRGFLSKRGAAPGLRSAINQLNRALRGEVAYLSRERLNVMRELVGLEPVVSLTTVPVCPTHGIAHICDCKGKEGVAKWVAQKRKREYRRLDTMPVGILSWKIRNREEVKYEYNTG